MYHDLSYYEVPLPEDVEKLKTYGDYDGAKRLIKTMLGREKTSETMKKRLLLELDVLKVLGDSEYPYTFEHAASMMHEQIRDFCDEELVSLKESGEADWIYINGEVHFQRLFLENLVKTRPDYAKRQLVPDEEAEAEKKLDLLNKNVRIMKEQGGRCVKIRLRVSVQPTKDFARVGEKVRVHMPFPKKCQQISDVKLLYTSQDVKFVDGEDAPQRTIYFETELREDQKFEMEYEYINRVPYIELEPERAEGIVLPTFYTQEQPPHISFTPYLWMLLDEIIGTETNPIRRARRIYDYVTQQSRRAYEIVKKRYGACRHRKRPSERRRGYGKFHLLAQAEHRKRNNYRNFRSGPPRKVSYGAGRLL